MEISLGPAEYIIAGISKGRKHFNIVQSFNDKTEALKFYKKAQKEGILVYFANVEKASLDGKPFETEIVFKSE